MAVKDEESAIGENMTIKQRMAILQQNQRKNMVKSQLQQEELNEKKENQNSKGQTKSPPKDENLEAEFCIGFKNRSITLMEKTVKSKISREDHVFKEEQEDRQWYFEPYGKDNQFIIRSKPNFQQVLTWNRVKGLTLSDYKPDEPNQLFECHARLLKDMKRNLDIIFVGNPGVGKSTLVATVSNSKEIESGFSAGTGCTKELKFVKDHNGNGDIRYGDTPGLADHQIAHQAAKEIEAALNDSAEKERNVKLVFVATSEAGRIRPSDLNTIQKIMSSIRLDKATNKSEKAPKNSYSVIINKFPEKIFKSKAFDPNAGRARFEAPFLRKNENFEFTTEHIFYMFKDEKMMNKTNATFDEKKAEMLRQLLFEMAPSLSGIKNCSKIAVDQYEAELQEMTNWSNRILEGFSENDSDVRKAYLKKEIQSIMI